jgi:uncharacterized protein with von Willebrand factor type A (vWA) domain
LADIRADQVGGGLFGRLIQFSRALRHAGIPVSASEEIDATAVMTAIELTERWQLREGLAAALVKSPSHRKAFDVIFDIWYPSAQGAPSSTEDNQMRGDESDVDRLRDLLAEALLLGDDDELRRIAEQAVASLGRQSAGPGRQSWFSYRVMRQMSPETLISTLLAEMLRRPDTDEPPSAMDEMVARATISDRTATFRRQVEAETRRRLVEERGADAVARHAVPALADQVDFLRATRDDLAELRRTVQPLARRLAARLALQRRHPRRGRLDIRRTVRASLATGGVPVVTHFKARRPHKPELVVLCDVSGSTASFAHFTLLLTRALREQFAKLRAFAFVDGCDEITRFLGPDIELPDAVSRLMSEARVVQFDGHSDYGRAFETFEDNWPDAVGPNTSLLILGDARTNFRDPGLTALKNLNVAARHTYWLNPEPRRHWDSGDSVAGQYADIVPMIECRNAAQLAHFVQQLLPQ